MNHDDSAGLRLPERRSVLGMLLGAGLLAHGEAALASADADRKPPGAPPPSASPALPMSEAQVLTFMKLYASTATELAPWYYTGRIYAVQEATAPRHLFDFEGTEFYAVRRTGPTDWLVGSSTLTFFRDHATGAYLQAFDNPYTGRSAPVKPNRLGTGDKRTPVSARGIGMAGDQTLPWDLELQSNGGVTWLTTSRYLTKAPQPWIEVQSMFAPTAQIDDASRASASSTFVSTYLAPWLGWMDMKDVPGHLMWHAAGRKLASLDELPAPYRKRADATAPEHFLIR
jgi:hypothetical protein